MSKETVEVTKDAELEKHFAKAEARLPIEILKNPDLLSLILEELDSFVVGEIKAKKAIFIHACHIFVKNPAIKLHAFVNSESSTGKSYVTKKIFDIFPEGCKIYRNKLSNETFTYWNRSKQGWSSDNKLLVLDDPKESLLNGDTFKTMLSEGAKSTVVINQQAVDIDIKGTPNVLLTTANNKPNDEIENRFNFINLDESKEQTINIYKKQAELARYGNKPFYSEEMLTAMKMLECVEIAIPFSEQLWTLFPANSVKGRRDFPRFLELIKSSAALHQHQREKDSGKVLAQREDYEIARSIITNMNINENLVVLTHSLRKAYETCIKLSENDKWFTIDAAYKKNPIVSERQWQRYIGELTTKSLLEVDVLDLDLPGRKPRIFRAKNSSDYQLPDFNGVIS